MKATITDDCTLCGLCEDTCPEVFTMGDEKAQVKVNPIPPELEDKAKEAAEQCPVQAIVLE
ncbi:MAG: ferredoxin [Armatimonadota bacterium]|nr:ferredoxin [Armatimonadota bacterium]